MVILKDKGLTLAQLVKGPEDEGMSFLRDNLYDIEFFHRAPLIL